jgi:hypothetical protein
VSRFTFDSFSPRLPRLLRDLVDDDSEASGAEMLVPTGGTFPA